MSSFGDRQDVRRRLRDEFLQVPSQRDRFNVSLLP